MPIDADHLRDANPWHPITNPRTLKFLGKLAEELGEASSATARCVIQGLDEAEPVTGKVNRQWLQDELADVLANIELVVEELKLDMDAMCLRKLRKIAHLGQWHRML